MSKFRETVWMTVNFNEDIVKVGMRQKNAYLPTLIDLNWGKMSKNNCNE